jgi:hypothetical protein
MSGTAPLRHEECWLLLPWLANGRLPAAERVRVDAHLHECAECQHELAWQRRACEALAEPDRVTYAPGPSLRKLMRRIDARGEAAQRRPARRTANLSAAHAAWRPPGLAWAASFAGVVALGLLAPVAYRWSEPLYSTHTASMTTTPNVLHVAFERSLPVGDVEELLQSAGARVVEGPGSTGIFGVAPVAAPVSQAVDARGVSQELRALATRLRSDPRVRWVEPLPASDTDQVAQHPRAPSR